MIVDTSAWIEYLRATGSPTHIALRTRIKEGHVIATPAPVLMELLAGCRTELAALELHQFLNRFEILVPDSLRDYQGAAHIYRTCRRAGLTVRSMVDCLVAAAALGEDRPLLARNRDFGFIALHTELDLVAP